MQYQSGKLTEEAEARIHVMRDNTGSLKGLDGLKELLRERRERMEDRHVPSEHLEVVQLDGQGLRQEDCYGLRHKETDIRFSDISWKQFTGKIVGLPEGFVESLHRENRKLLIDNMEHCLQRQKEPYLLRLQKEGDDKSRRLRALLDGRYNRVDNIFLMKPLQSLCRETGWEVRNILYDGDDLTIQIMDPVPQSLLHNTGDKVLAGISIINSEVGRKASLVVQAYFERLVCTNGMTVKETVTIRAPKKLGDVIDTGYPNELPAYPLSERLEEEMRMFFFHAWNRLTEGTAQHIDTLRREMEKLESQHLPLTDERSVRSHIEAMLYHSGLRTQRGINIDDIYEAYQEERRDFASTNNSALILYNAFTRYASNYLTDPGRRRRGRRRRGGRQVNYPSSVDNLALANALTSQSHRLHPHALNWRKVAETAEKRNKRETSVLPPI